MQLFSMDLLLGMPAEQAAAAAARTAVGPMHLSRLQAPSQASTAAAAALGDGLQAEGGALAWDCPRCLDALAELKDAEGRTALMLAASGGHADVVSALLAGGVRVDSEDQHGNTALSWAAQRARGPHLVLSGLSTPESEPCYPDVVKRLLEHGAEVDHRAHGQKTPLLFAVGAGCAEVVCALLRAGADVNATDEKGWSALCKACSDSKAPQDVVKALLEKGAHVDHKAGDGRAPLHLAAKHNLADITGVLLRANANVEVCLGHTGATPLIVAAECGHVEVVRALLPAADDATFPKANVNACDAGGYTALAKAVRMRQHTSNGDMQVVEHLLGCMCNMEHKDNMGCTALHHAAMRGDLALVKRLVDAGASPFAKSNGNQQPVDVVGAKMGGQDTETCSRSEAMLGNRSGAVSEAVPQAASIGGRCVVGRKRAELSPEAQVQAVQTFLRKFASAAELVESEGLRSILNGISVVAVLIVTVTFIGLQTPPGGPSDGDGGLVKLQKESYADACEKSKPVLMNRTALHAFFILDGLSLFLAATDLLLVLSFLLPGVATLFQRLEQAAWVWCMLASSSVLLALALLCAVGAYVAAALAVLPAESHWIVYVILFLGGYGLLVALVMLLVLIIKAMPLDTYKFLRDKGVGMSWVAWGAGFVVAAAAVVAARCLAGPDAV